MNYSFDFPRVGHRHEVRSALNEIRYAKDREIKVIDKLIQNSPEGPQREFFEKRKRELQ